MRYSFVVLDKNWNNNITLSSISRLSKRESFLYKKERYKHILYPKNCDLVQTINNSIRLGFTELHPMFNLAYIDSINNSGGNNIIADNHFEDIIFYFDSAFVLMSYTILPPSWITDLKLQN